MNRRRFLQATTLATLSPAFSWGASPDAQKLPEPELPQVRLDRWIELAERLKPHLQETKKIPTHIVKPTADSACFLRWRMDAVSPAGALPERLMRSGDHVVLDFGSHMTGHFSVSIAGEGRGVDSPALIKFIFGEVPAEIVTPFSEYKGGLSRSWLQDEVVSIDVLPTTVRLPRRYAFRYVKIEVVAISGNYAVRFENPTALALTSAGTNHSPLPAGAPEALRRIDEVSLATLRDCMQTVFEDGPKRDRRLWIGDMRLQALTNYATFRNFDLVKRCLYLFAGLPREDGFVSALVAEVPRPLRGHEYIIDYAALYGAAVLDYAKASGDWVTARDLWPVVRRQMEILNGYVGADGLFAAPKGTWVFIDWQDRLERTAAMHGVFVFSLRQALELATAARDSEAVAEYTKRIGQMTAAGRKAFFDPAQGVFVSGRDRQVSWASQAWMVLSGIATPSEGAAALRAAQKNTQAVRPGSPYLYHYFVEAMLQCGLKAEALELIQTYWGGMIKNGADTFWEVYDPANPLLSPYGDVLVNSYCHAWSCTPAYLLRTGALV